MESRKKILPALIAGILLTSVSPAIAGNSFSDADSKDLTELSLEELLNMEVSSTTRSNLSVRRAPGVVRVFTAEDIEKFNFSTLADLLRNIPGTQLQEYRQGHQLVWVRGVQSRYNDKVLLLIDGVPFRDSYYGNFTVDEMIPVQNIEKVEVISGPGSVLFGSNAFSGVINITTKSEGNMVQASYASFNSVSGNAGFSLDDFYGYADFFRTDGFSPELNADGKVWPHEQDASRLYGMLKYKNDNFTAIGSYTNYSYPYKYKESKKEETLNRRPFYGTLRYSSDASDLGTFNIQGYYNNYGFTRTKHKLNVPGEIKSTSEENLDTLLFGVDADYNFELGGHALLAGFSFIQDRGDNISVRDVFPEAGEPEQNLNVKSIARNDIGLYLQDVWTLNKNLALTGGVRYDFLSHFNDQLNFRVGLTGESDSLTETGNNNLYGKLLFGTAFRSPSYREYLDIRSFNNDLQPEHLSTFEAQAGYLLDFGDINLTLYHNNYRNFTGDIIVEKVKEGNTEKEIDDEMYFNFKERNITGLELNSFFYPLQNLTVNLGGAVILNAREEIGDGVDLNKYITSEKINTGLTDVAYLANYTMNLLTSYRFFDNYNAGFNVIYSSDRRVPEFYQNDVPAENKNLSNARGFVHLDVFGSAKIIDNLFLDLKVTNLLDTKIYSLPFRQPAGYDAEWPGRRFKVDLRYHF